VTRLSLPLAALLAAAPFAAAADGNGLAVGDTARLHASFETEERYDSLAALGGIGNAQTPVYDPADLITHLRPGLRLDAPGAQTSFTGAARLDYEIFAGLGGPTRSLSFLAAAADAGLQTGHGGSTTFDLVDHFSRSDRTSNPALGIGTITDSNNLDARLGLLPGGGALELGLGYNFGIEAYELHSAGNVGCAITQPSCDGTKYGGFGSQTHRGTADVRWRFLPKTAAMAEVSWAARSYSSASSNVNTKPLRASLGLLGLITEKVRVVLKAGYENTFASTGQNYAGLVGQAELGWEPGITTKVAVGVLRSAESVSDLYGWYSDSRLYASLSMLFIGKLLVTGGANVDLLGFANRGRNDVQSSANVLVEYEFNRLLRGGLGSVLTIRSSSEGGAFNYQRAEAFARLTVAY
jgi:hypothetical protein